LNEAQTQEAEAQINGILASSSGAAEQISVLKDRLSEMFRREADVLAAPTIEEKVRCAAETLTGPGFYSSCTVYLDDVDQGALIVHSGLAETVGPPTTERYRQARAMLAGAGQPVSLNSGDAEPGLPGTILVPMKNHAGRMVGAAELAFDDEILGSAEMLTLVQVFLMQA
jgi:hypothetical protein